MVLRHQAEKHERAVLLGVFENVKDGVENADFPDGLMKVFGCCRIHDGTWEWNDLLQSRV